MRLLCPQCDHVITGNECDCGFSYRVARPQPPPEPPKVTIGLYEGHPLLL